MVAAGGFDLRDIIRRWVRGFHAALYREALSLDASFMTLPPLAEADQHTGQVKEVPKVVPEFVKTIYENRALGNIDRAICRNGKCTYECVWVRADNERWFCVYALDLYRWSELGDSTNFGTRGCVGCYVPPAGVPPAGATRGIRPSDRELQNPLNPFAEEPSGDVNTAPVSAGGQDRR